MGEGGEHMNVRWASLRNPEQGMVMIIAVFAVLGYTKGRRMEGGKGKNWWNRKKERCMLL